MWHLSANGAADRLSQVLSMALEAGMDFTHRAALNGSGASPLFIASLFGHKACVRLLLDHRLSATSNTDVDLADAHGNTALMAAACRGKPGCVHLLLGAGADPNCRNARGYSALDAALDFARPDCVSLLLRAGARPPPQTAVEPLRGDPKGYKRDWDRVLSAQEWWQQPGLPGQSRRARELNAQMKQHAMCGTDVQLLQDPLQRFASAHHQHVRELGRSQGHSLQQAARQMKREETIYRHRERVTRAALITGSTVL